MFTSFEQTSPATVRPQVFENADTITLDLLVSLKTVSSPPGTVLFSLTVRYSELLVSDENCLCSQQVLGIYIGCDPVLHNSST